MSKPYDAVSKRLIGLRPTDWVVFLGLPIGVVSLIDTDLATISVAADRLIRVDTTNGAYLIHNELESGKGTLNAPKRMFHYNAVADYKYELPVISNLFLLRKESNSPVITGTYQRTAPDGSIYLHFSYNVIRVWELEVEQLLSGGLSLLPFAPIANVREDNLSSIIQIMQRRFQAEAVDSAEEAELWIAADVLMGLRYNTTFKRQLLRGVRQMRESITYQEILDEGRTEGRVEGRLEGRTEGRVEEAQSILLRIGVRRLGILTHVNEAKIRNLHSLTILELLLDRVIEVETWEELLAGI